MSKLKIRCGVMNASSPSLKRQMFAFSHLRNSRIDNSGFVCQSGIRFSMSALGRSGPEGLIWGVIKHRPPAPSTLYAISPSGPSCSLRKLLLKGRVLFWHKIQPLNVGSVVVRVLGQPSFVS